MKRFMSATLLSTLVLLTSPSQAAEDDTVIAVINGEKITQNQLVTFAREQGPQTGINPNSPDVQNRIISYFIDRELLYQAALKKDYEKKPEVKARIDEARHQVLSWAFVEDLIAEQPITEDEIKAAYQEQVVARQSDEYRIAHIQLNTEADAKAAMARLEKGEKFDDLARELSKDITAKDGGELGWMSLNSLPEAMAKAVKETKANSYAKTPIQLDDGWHIIKVFEHRAVKAPAYGAVHDQLKRHLTDQMIQNYIAGLKEKAKIEFPKEK